MKLCKLCKKRPAEIPDRNIQGRPIKSICKQCHVERIKQDMARIVKQHDNMKK